MNPKNALLLHLAKIKATKAANIALSKLARFTIIVGIVLLPLVILSSCGGGSPYVGGSTPTTSGSTPSGEGSTPTTSAPTETIIVPSPPVGPTKTVIGPTPTLSHTPTHVGSHGHPPPVGPTPTAMAVNGSPLVFGSALSTLQIEVDIPPLQVNHQTLVRVSLFPTGGNIPVSHVDVIPNSTVSVAQATPVGTPGTTLKEAFGSNNVVNAFATLETNSSTFTVDPSGPQEEPLDLERVTWDWYVTPLIPGKQVIGVYIEVTWQPKTGGQSSPPYTIGDSILQVNVGAPFNFQLMLSIVLTILGTIIVPLTVALIAVPGFRKWAIKLFRNKKPQTRRKNLESLGKHSGSQASPPGKNLQARRKKPKSPKIRFKAFTADFAPSVWALFWIWV